MSKKDAYQNSDEDFILAVNSSKNIREVLLKCNLIASGSNYNTFKIRCAKLCLNIDHFKSDKDIRINISDIDIINACKNNFSRMSALRTLGLNENTNSNNYWINRKICDLNIDKSHWTGMGHLKNKENFWSKKSNEDYFVKGVNKRGNNIKVKLIKEKLLDYKCYRCGINSWNNESLSLHLEHINGDHFDNRLENLTLLCPNCHSQTKTYCRKKK